MSELREAEQERLCDALIRQFGGEIIRQSQRRASQVTEGLSDRQYYVLDAHVVFEVKAEDGQLTAEQFRLLELHYSRGQGIVCCGTLEDLRVFLPALRRSREEGRALGWRLVQLWAARGFRRPSKRRT